MSRSRALARVAIAAVTTVAMAAVITVSVGSQASAATTPPPFEPDPLSIGGLVFLDAGGHVLTGGNIADGPFATFVQATGPGRSGDTKATLFGYLPSSANATGDFAGEQLSLSTSYDFATENPKVTLTPADETLSVLAGNFPNAATDAYEGLYQLRLKTSGPGQTAGEKYYSADIRITGSTWTVAYSNAAVFAPLVPARLLETRSGRSTIDGLFNDIGAIAANGTIQLTVAGRGGIFADASAAALNVTVTEPAADGFITVYPCGSPQPEASNLNYVTGQTIPNAVVSQIGTNGQVCLFSSQATHLVVDVDGAYPAGSPYVALVPARLLETRAGKTTIDGQAANGGPVVANSETPLTVTGRGGVSATASSVVLNVTVTEPNAAGFITVYPCGSPQPEASNLNYVTGQTIPNLVISKVGTNGQVCLFSSQATQLVVDVNGYYESGSAYVPLVPGRVLETRTGKSTVDGLFNGIGPVAVDSDTPLTISGRGGVAGTASSAVLNVTVTEPAAPGFVTVYPCGSERPLASNLNFVAGETIANAVVSKIGTGGNVCLFSSQATQLVVDVNGYYP
jgi:hypothetical protein